MTMASHGDERRIGAETREAKGNNNPKVRVAKLENWGLGISALAGQNDQHAFALFQTREGGGRNRRTSVSYIIC